MKKDEGEGVEETGEKEEGAKVKDEEKMGRRSAGAGGGLAGMLLFPAPKQRRWWVRLSCSCLCGSLVSIPSPVPLFPCQRSLVPSALFSSPCGSIYADRMSSSILGLSPFLCSHNIAAKACICIPA